jgi:hypothetical protein
VIDDVEVAGDADFNIAGGVHFGIKVRAGLSTTGILTGSAAFLAGKDALVGGVGVAVALGFAANPEVFNGGVALVRAGLTGRKLAG